MNRSRHSFDDLFGLPDVVAEKATRREDLVVIYTSSIDGAKLHTLRIEEMAIVLEHTQDISGEVTCLEVVRIADRQLLVVGVSDGEGPLLCLSPLAKAQDECQTLSQRIGRSKLLIWTQENADSCSRHQW